MSAIGRRTGALALAACALLGLPATASADPCTATYADAAGFKWDFATQGSAFFGEVVSGGSAAGGTFGPAFDPSTFVLDVRKSDGSSPISLSVDGSSCSTTSSGWSFAPVDRTQANALLHGVRVGRSFSVPPGADFGRLLTDVENAGAVPVTVQLSLRTNWAGSTPAYATSSGDGAWTVADRWIAMRDDPPAPSDPAVAVLWDGAGASDNYDDVTLGAGTSGGGPVWVVALAPGERRTLMTVIAQRPTREAAAAFAEANADGRALVAGLTGAQMSAIANWRVADTDGDGVPAAADRCPAVADPDQADTDGDGLGDACDPDTDGDGLPDAVEAALGSDRRSTDSDRDGRPDGADACPTLAGAGTANGCPDALRVPLRLALKLQVGASIARAALLRRGMAVTITAGRPASITVQLVLSPRRSRGRAARAGDVVIGEARLRRGGGRRTLTVRPARAQRALVRRGTRLMLRTVATDAAGVSATASRSVRVR